MKKLTLIIMLLISCSGFAADWCDQQIPGEFVYSNPVYTPMPGDYIVAMPEVHASNIVEQPLTADTPAVESVWYESSIKKLLDLLVELVLGWVFAWITGIYAAIRKWIATTKYGQEIGILMDALRLAISRKAKEKGKHYSEIVAGLIKIVSDLNIDDAEKQQLIAIRNEIRADAVQIAHESFKQLRGWAKDKGTAWIAERIDLLLGELESRLFDLKEN